jgi:hypothetical protein
MIAQHTSDILVACHESDFPFAEVEDVRRTREEGPVMWVGVVTKSGVPWVEIDWRSLGHS